MWLFKSTRIVELEAELKSARKVADDQGRYAAEMFNSSQRAWASAAQVWDELEREKERRAHNGIDIRPNPTLGSMLERLLKQVVSATLREKGEMYQIVVLLPDGSKVTGEGATIMGTLLTITRSLNADGHK